MTADASACQSPRCVRARSRVLVQKLNTRSVGRDHSFVVAVLKASAIASSASNPVHNSAIPCPRLHTFQRLRFDAVTRPPPSPLVCQSPRRPCARARKAYNKSRDAISGRVQGRVPSGQSPSRPHAHARTGAINLSTTSGKATTPTG